jgi:hypothetical protein
VCIPTFELGNAALLPGNQHARISQLLLRRLQSRFLHALLRCGPPLRLVC